MEQPTETPPSTTSSDYSYGEGKARLLEAVLASTPDLAYVFDLNHRFVYANSALLAMWGKTWEEAEGRTCLELGYEPWHAEMHGREIEEVVRSGMPVRGEVPFGGTSGRRIYDYIFTPICAADGADGSQSGGMPHGNSEDRIGCSTPSSNRFHRR